MPDYQFVSYTPVGTGRVVRVMLDRPRSRNAQNRGLLVELDDALSRAEADDDVRVVVLGGNGAAFSSGHDLGSSQARLEYLPGQSQHPTFRSHGATRAATEARVLQEWHFYFENTLRWRGLRKTTIAEVHGDVVAAALMLAWCCDLIVAADDTRFAEVVGTRLGMCGGEYAAHSWEFGSRRAKHLMLTGDAVTADEAYDLGMVCRVFPHTELNKHTDEFAERIAQVPSMTALMIKDSVNQAVDAMGFPAALQACFSLHQINHAHWAEVHGDGYAVGRTEDGLADWRHAELQDYLPNEP